MTSVSGTVSSYLLHQPGGTGGDVDDPASVEPEDHSSLQRRRGVVEVDDGLARPGDGLVGALDQLGPALNQHLDGHILGDAVLLDDLPDEVEVRLGGGRESDLDLLESHADQRLEEPQLAVGVHGIDEGLVAVAQIHAAPQRRGGEVPVGPGPVRQLQRAGRTVPLVGHLTGGGVGVGSHGGSPFGSQAKKKPPDPEAQEVSASTDMWCSPTSEGGGRWPWWSWR